MSHVNSPFRSTAYVLLALCVALSGCANQMEPAKKAIADIEAAVTAVGVDAQQYIPDDLKAVTDQLASLKAKFDQKDYAGVIAAAPALLTKAQGLLGAKDTAMREAAARQAAAQQAAEQALSADWGALSGTLPAEIAAIDSRVNILKKSKKLPGNLTKAAFDAAQADLADAKSLWDQASGAQAAGKLGDAVMAAQQAKEKADAALSSLGMGR